MPLPTPGSSFNNVIDATSRIRQRGGRSLRPVSPGNVAPPISTLQSLSPSDLAALGLVAAVAARNSDNSFQEAFENALQPALVVNPEDPGQFGESGIGYEITVFNGNSGVAISPSFTLYGPIDTQILSGVNGFGMPIAVWRFDGFDAFGNPRQNGFLNGATRFTWTPDDSPHTFEVVPLSDPDTVIQPNPGTGSPLEVPQPSDLPTRQPQEIPSTEEALAAQSTSLDTIIDDVAAITPLIEEVADAIENQFDCDVCGLLNGLGDNQVLNQTELTALVEEFRPLLTYWTNTQTINIPVATCDEGITDEMNSFTNERQILVLELLQFVLNDANLKYLGPCVEQPAIPNAWLSQPAPNRPTLVLSYRERNESGVAVRTRSYSIPNAIGSLPTSAQSFTKGPWLTSILYEDRSSIKVYASTEQESIAQANFFAQFVDPDMTVRGMQTALTAGFVTNNFTMELIRADFYAQGRANFPTPTSSVRISQQAPNTINPPLT